MIQCPGITPSKLLNNDRPRFRSRIYPIDGNEVGDGPVQYMVGQLLGTYVFPSNNIRYILIDPMAVLLFCFFVVCVIIVVGAQPRVV